MVTKYIDGALQFTMDSYKMVRVTARSGGFFALLLVVLVGLTTGEVSAQNEGTLRVGVARVNVTPPADAALRMSGYGGRDDGFKGIHDSLYYRVIVVGDGRTEGAIVTGDILAIRDGWFEELAPRIENEAGIPRSRLILAATHSHGGPESMYAPIYESGRETPSERLVAYTRDVADKVVAAVSAARASMVPARVGAGRGYANVNINRTARTADGGYSIGQNPDGPSDKAVHVVKFERLDGEPIAILVNYAVHAVVGGSENYQITADLPGVTSRMVERHYGADVVAAWTSGAAGDQNPIYQGVANLDAGQLRPMEILGTILGEEVIRVAEKIDRMTNRATVRGAQTVITIPRKQRDDGAASNADPLGVRLTVLMVNNIALTSVSGQPLTGIGIRLKEESPYAHTILITNSNGRSGYLPTDEGLKTPGYEVSAAAVAEGTEDALIEGLLDLIYGL